MAISTITSNSIADGAVTSSDLASGAVEQAMTTQIGGRRNLIINGAMQVAQRGTSKAFSTDSYGFIVDRYEINNYLDDTVTVSQSSTAPEGFANSIKYAFSSGDSSLAANDYLALLTKLEGQDLQHLKKGTSNAESVTLSFWIRSSVTGTYIAELNDYDNNRSVSQAYTVNSADTWEKKELTFSGDTVGTLDNDNNLSMWLMLWFAAGSTFTGGTLSTSWASRTNANRVVGQVNAAASSSNEIYITGVQLEVGSVATPFEHRSFGEELALCQRYFCKIENTTNGGRYFGVLQAYQSDSVFGIVADYPQVMRTTPSVGQGGTFGFYKADSGSGGANSTITNLGSTSRSWQTGGWGGSSVLTAGHAAVTFWEVGAYLTADAEL